MSISKQSEMVALVELQERWNKEGAPGPWHLASCSAEVCSGLNTTRAFGSKAAVLTWTMPWGEGADHHFLTEGQETPAATG